MDDDLLDSIRADPTNPDLRAALAGRWAGTPEGELVRILLGPPAVCNMHEIRSWFERHAAWPEPGMDDLGDSRTRASMMMQEWLARSFDPECWPDEESRRSAILAVVGHILADARAILPVDDPDRVILEEIEAALTAEPPGAASIRLTVPGGRGPMNTYGPEEGLIASLALRAARSAHASICAAPWDPRSEVAGMELMPQFRILGWSWLGLPPLIADGGLRNDRLLNPEPAGSVARSWLGRLWGRIRGR